MRFWVFVLAIAMITPASARAAMEDYPTVKLQGLDKSTARTTTFEAQVGTTITYGPLFVRIQACRKAPPIEKPESAAFLQIWEVPPETGKSEWVFSGWMFASSPALSSMDHPVYDIWVLDCLGREEPNEEAKQSETDATTSQEELSAPDPNAPTTETQGTVTPTEEVIDSEAQPEEPATDTDVPVDSEAGAPEPSTDPVPNPESTMPASPAPGGAYDPDAPYNPGATPYINPDDAPYSPPPAQGGGAAPYDPNAPYSPSQNR